MLFDERRLSGPAIHWPGGKPRDRVEIPDHAVPLLVAAKLTARITGNFYEIVNEYGDALQLPFGCNIESWQEAISQLLAVRQFVKDDGR